MSYTALRMRFRKASLLLLCLTLPAQHSETTLTNPFNSPGDRARGAAFFQSQCASCHGLEGKGGATGPKLAGGNFRHAPTDEAMFRVITKGIPGTAMPGFAMNGREIWQVVAYVRSLHAPSPSGIAGNAVNGAKIVAAQKCAGCHWIEGQGSVRGLDLGLAARRLGPSDIRRALEDPGADVAPQYWIWQAKTKDGATHRGYRLNEDTFSIQILDNAANLRTLLKSEIAEQTLERRSPMPSFKGKLTESEMNDVVAYIAGLRGAPAQ